jgi:hypothetical protein
MAALGGAATHFGMAAGRRQGGAAAMVGLHPIGTTTALVRPGWSPGARPMRSKICYNSLIIAEKNGDIRPRQLNMMKDFRDSPLPP